MTAFLVAPVLLFLAAVIASSQAVGLRDAVFICLGLAVVGLLGALVLLFLGRARLQVPDLKRWESEGEPAWESPPLLERLRAPSPRLPDDLGGGRRGQGRRGGRGGPPESPRGGPAELPVPSTEERPERRRSA